MTMLFTGVQQSPRYNQPLYGFHAKYTLSAGIELPFFVTTMPLERAIEELKIHDEVPPSLERKWSLSELFQRELDKDRVKRDLVQGYLNDATKLKFFNAITIVLMPKTEDGHLLQSFPAATFDPPIPWDGQDEADAGWGQAANARRENFGGVQYVIVGDQGRLRWNPELVHAVAVDGQHRLLALRQFRDESRARALNPKERETSIPVLFLLLDPAPGFVHPGNSALSIRAVSRELFTDLNKNAKQVDTARQLILDDLSIEARCLRTLVTNETATDSTEILPLSLVRWQDANNRFDQKYYLNSLVHLDLVIDTILDLRPPKDPLDKDNVLEFIRSLDEALGISTGNTRQLRSGDRSLKKVFEEEYCNSDGEVEVPFMRLPSDFLDASVRGFRENHHGWLLRLIRDFKPYAGVLGYARQHNLIEGEFGRFWAQSEHHRSLLKQEKLATNGNWYEQTIQRHIEAIEELKGADENAQWAFKAIFQKALVRLGRVVAFESGGADLNLGSIDDLLAVLSGLYDRDVLKVGRELANSDFKLWTFVATNLGGTKIKVAKSTENRIFALLSLWYYGNRRIAVERELDANRQFTAKELLSYFKKSGSRAMWPRCDEHVGLLFSAFDVQGLHGKDVNNVAPRTRKRKVWEHLIRVFATGINAALAESTLGAEEDDLDSEEVTDGAAS